MQRPVREADIAQGTSDDPNSAIGHLHQRKFYIQPVKPSITQFMFTKRHYILS